MKKEFISCGTHAELILRNADTWQRHTNPSGHLRGTKDQLAYDGTTGIVGPSKIGGHTTPIA